MTNRLFIVGDVHGCSEEFDAHFDRLRPTDQDRVIFAGDLVDKGPDSAGVVRRVREMAQRLQVDLVLGNHEENHIRWMAKTDDKKAEMKRHLEFVEIHRHMTDADREYLHSALLYIHLPALNVVVTHGGVPESMKSLPDPKTIASLSRKDRDWYKQMCRLRCVDEQGRFVGLYETKPEHQFWADRYDGRLGHVFFGHQPYMEEMPHAFPHASGIDLGCVFGGYLCAVELDSSDGTRVATHTEQGRKKYANYFNEE